MLLWQDPVPAGDYPLISERDARKLKSAILDSGLTVPELVRVAWASAATYRNTDMRGGANGARVRLEPQVNWAANNPDELAKVLTALEKIQQEFNGKKGKRKISLADLIVLGGNSAIEQASKDAGIKVDIPFTSGRADATQAQTDVASFALLEPKADGFRNYYSDDSFYAPAEALVDKASLLNLSVPEMTALLGGMRVLNANTGGQEHGVFTDRPGQLTSDFFVNLLDMSTQWTKSDTMPGIYEGRDRSSGNLKWTATTVDLLFGSNTELRAVAEVYASDDGKEKLVEDFVAAWSKVMNADRFDQ